MDNNNKRIAIAIVAMFVVALSIIGFTYAYFTARVTANTTSESVKITAGKLEVTYTAGQLIRATGIVPGWKSDGLSYFNPTVISEGNKIIAQHANTYEEIPKEYSTSAWGVVEPSTFTVKNTGDKVAYYAVRLKNIKNGLSTETGTTNNIDDRKNLVAKLYKGTYVKGTSPSESNLVGEEKAVFSDSEDGTVVISKALQVGESQEVNYYIILEYKNNPDVDQSESMKKTVEATVEVVGITQTQEGSAWVDANGNTIISDQSAAI